VNRCKLTILQHVLKISAINKINTDAVHASDQWMH